MKVSKRKIEEAMPAATFKALRENLGLSNGEAAAVLGLASPHLIGGFERGARRVPEYVGRHLTNLALLARWEAEGKKCGLHVETVLTDGGLLIRGWTLSNMLELLDLSPFPRR